uniref:Uncharacterized protein n=1 Tax=Knipowitschia caucasica TaxID=637954 RepID=A0AAV2KIC3_KNICA
MTVKEKLLQEQKTPGEVYQSTLIPVVTPVMEIYYGPADSPPPVRTSCPPQRESFHRSRPSCAHQPTSAWFLIINPFCRHQQHFLAQTANTSVRS